jgi:hypothetical protein
METILQIQTCRWVLLLSFDIYIDKVHFRKEKNAQVTTTGSQKRNHLRERLVSLGTWRAYGTG